MSNKPLTGIKVVELATFIAAATAGRFLADSRCRCYKDRK